MPVADRFGRPVHDLRISVTDRCNLRCRYCMPREVFGPEYVFLERRDLLTYEEITRVARVFVGLGVEKIRITGGEPLVRKELPDLVRSLAAIEEVRDLTLTTNGVLLPRFAPELKAAGLDRVTVSLDSLDDVVFMRMNDSGITVASVLAGIEAAAAAGLRPVKVNAVVQRGVNDHTVVELAERFRGTDHILRFIEYMDVGNSNGWQMTDVVPGVEIVERIDARYPLEPVEENYAGEVARRWQYRDGGGEIGIITSVTRPFCTSCTRARLSPDGRLVTCLFASAGFDLRALLRGGASDEALTEAIRNLWGAREDRYSLVRTGATPGLPKVEMSYIGG